MRAREHARECGERGSPWRRSRPRSVCRGRCGGTSSRRSVSAPSVPALLLRVPRAPISEERWAATAAGVRCHHARVGRCRVSVVCARMTGVCFNMTLRHARRGTEPNCIGERGRRSSDGRRQRIGDGRRRPRLRVLVGGDERLEDRASLGLPHRGRSRAPREVCRQQSARTHPIACRWEMHATAGLLWAHGGHASRGARRRWGQGVPAVL